MPHPLSSGLQHRRRCSLGILRLTPKQACSLAWPFLILACTDVLPCLPWSPPLDTAAAAPPPFQWLFVGTTSGCPFLHCHEGICCNLFLLLLPYSPAHCLTALALYFRFLGNLYSEILSTNSGPHPAFQATDSWSLTEEGSTVSF